MEPEQLKKLTDPFPRDAIKQRKLNPKDPKSRVVDYVEGFTVIRRLNEATGNNWNLEILSLTSDKVGGGEMLRAHVRLTLPGLGSREHIGIQSLYAGGGEDLAKGVITDALKKCATLFGVGLELFGPDYEADDYIPSSARPAPTPTHPPAAPPRPAQAAPGPQQTIDAAQVRILQALCDCKGVGADRVCTKYKVRSLPELTPADFWAAKKGLEAMPDAPAEASS